MSSTITALDIHYMERAIALARKGSGFVNPNPLVGAVIVKNSTVIGEGYHARFGAAHAERAALSACTEVTQGATLYVTLEPCAHYGKTPPCTEIIIASKIARVVIGSHDPNPLVSGKGVAQLIAAGIEVVTGCAREACDKLNKIFFQYIQNNTPYTILKYAMTLDGKIATHTGDSKWVTSEEARMHVHRTRLRCAAIMVGINTVLVDDPLLTCRLAGGRNPVRIIVDTDLRTPLSSRIVKTAKDIPTYIATCSSDAELAAKLEKEGCHILQVTQKGTGVDLNQLMKKLGELKIDSVLLEGGAILAWSALQAGIVHKIEAYIAPKIIGGSAAPSPIGGTGFMQMSSALKLRNIEVSKIGEDILLEGEI